MLLTVRMASAGARAVVCVADATADIKNSVSPLPPAAGGRSAKPSPRFAGRGKEASARLVAGLRALRPRRILGHVVLGGCFEQRTHLVLHGRDPVGDLDPLGAVPLLHVGRVMAVMVVARHLDG